MRNTRKNMRVGLRGTGGKLTRTHAISHLSWESVFTMVSCGKHNYIYVQFFSIYIYMYKKTPQYVSLLQFLNPYENFSFFQNLVSLST